MISPPDRESGQSPAWTGNLVTNANAEHFWLNEGFTMYAERRIIEATEGPELARLSAALGRRELEESIERFAERPEMTKLRPNLTGVDPDDCYSLIPYEKGYFFIARLEKAAGRAKFEEWLKRYIADFRFGSLTTEEFEEHIERHLPSVLTAVDARTWIDGTGIPDSAEVPKSTRRESVEALAGTCPPDSVAAAWSATEWALYLEATPRPATLELCLELDAKLTRSSNYDVLVPWLTLALQSGYHAVLSRVEEVVSRVGRMKYLRPLYTHLISDLRTRELAKQLYQRNRAAYHPIARQMVEGLLAKV